MKWESPCEGHRISVWLTAHSVVFIITGNKRSNAKETWVRWQGLSAEILISSWYSIILIARRSRDYYCTHFIDGTKVQKSQDFAKSHTSECSRAGMLEVQESHQDAPLMAQALCWQPHCPRHPPPSPSLQPLTHHPYLCTLQGGRSNMEESKIQA